jgi:hypothetical protein
MALAVKTGAQGRNVCSSDAGRKKIGEKQEKALSLAVPFLWSALHSCRGFSGLTAYHYEVGPLVGESGVPLGGGLAHITPEAVPVKHYSAWACESHLQCRERFLRFSIGERQDAYKKKNKAIPAPRLCRETAQGV